MISVAVKPASLRKAFSSIFDIRPVRRPSPRLIEEYVSPSSSSSDTESMRKDFIAVGDDMRLALEQYGKKA
ncbi:hypothetical protein [Stutzerimonas nitrititolerans]|uniref:hypothetical protein n=1 Tax=Stutzerimonas nitrititolerans TaxID=2482751 RepID=UPI0028AF3DD8|nr:hypothetical protein [Stutzerimonas nitrititolerans]